MNLDPGNYSEGFLSVFLNINVMLCVLISGSLFSATAGPLLPDNIAFLPFNKMWKSPSKENCTDKILRKQNVRKLSVDSITSVDAPAGNIFKDNQKFQ